MAELNTALFRIDPTEGLLQYVQAVKPFHSKVLDVFVEYIYSEPLSASMVDKLYLKVGLEEAFREVTRTCGYGYVWNPYSQAAPGDLPAATIIAAEAQISVLATLTSGSPNITLDLIPSGYSFPVDSPVIFRTTGTLPPQLTPGHVYYVKTSVWPNLTVSATFGGSPITFSTAGTGDITVSPVGLPFNSFLIQMAPAVQHDVVVTDLARNQFAFATPHSITAVNPTLKRFTASGVSGLLAPGGTIYVSGNTDMSTNGKYTVQSVSGTQITVVEPVSLVATVTGDVYIPLAPDDVPYWPTGAAISVTSTGTYPFPLTNTGTYYFTPTPTLGSFNMSSRRYPQEYSDTIDITTRPSGRLKAYRVEPFVPGEQVTVAGSVANDGIYTINTILREGSLFRVYVLEPIAEPTPFENITDGTMTYTGSYGDPYCAVATAPDLYTAAFFTERIQFTFLDGGPPGPAPGV